HAAGRLQAVAGRPAGELAAAARLLTGRRPTNDTSREETADARRYDTGRGGGGCCRTPAARQRRSSGLRLGPTAVRRDLPQPRGAAGGTAAREEGLSRYRLLCHRAARHPVDGAAAGIPGPLPLLPRGSRPAATGRAAPDL